MMCMAFCEKISCICQLKCSCSNLDVCRSNIVGDDLHQQCHSIAYFMIAYITRDSGGKAFLLLLSLHNISDSCV